MNRRTGPMVRLALVSIVAMVALLAVSWAAPFKGAPSAQAVDGASLSISKTCSPEATVGGLVMYTFIITNTGSAALDRDSVVDVPNLGDISANFPAHLEPGQTATVTKFYFVQETDPRPLENKVTATYHVAGDTAVAVAEDTCSVNVPHLTITKTATFSDTSTTYTFTLTNDGNGTLIRFRVVDDVLGNISSLFPLVLAEGQQVVRQKTVGGLECRNTVKAAYQSASGFAVVDEDTCETKPRIDLRAVKECFPKTGLVTDPINVKASVTNTGQVELTVDSVVDSDAGALTFVGGDSNSNGKLDPGETWEYKGSYAGVVGDNTDQVTVTATAPDGTKIVRDSNTDTCNREKPPDGAKLTPTGTTCEQYRDGTVPDQNEVLYDIRNGKISNAVPGVFFYFTKVTIASTADTADKVSIDQSSSIGAWKEFAIKFVRVWDPKTAPSNCEQLFTVPACAGATDCTFELGKVGTFIVQVQYDSKSIIGSSPACSGGTPQVSTYSWVTKVDGIQVQSDSLQVKPKPSVVC